MRILPVANLNYGKRVLAHYTASVSNGKRYWPNTKPLCKFVSGQYCLSKYFLYRANTAMFIGGERIKLSNLLDESS